MTSISKWLQSKVIWTIIGAVAIYLVGASLGILPDSVKSTASWFGDHFDMIAALLMFVLGCYVVMQIMNRKQDRGQTP